MFSARGYPATTVTMIAREAELSVGTIYYHFKSVGDVYAAVVADVANVLEDCKAELTRQPSLRAQLLAMQRRDFRSGPLMGFLIRAHLDEVRAEPHPGRSLLLSDAAAFLPALVLAAIERGELPPDTDAQEVAGLLAAVVWGAGLYSGFVRRAGVMAGIARQVDELLAHGLPASHPETATPRACFG